MKLQKEIPDHPYRILIIVGRSGSGKMNALLNFINHQPEIGVIYLYFKDPYVLKYQYLINKCEELGLKHLKHPKGFIEYSNNVFSSIQEYDPGKEQKVLLVFDDMIADMISNNKTSRNSQIAIY